MKYEEVNKTKFFTSSILNVKTKFFISSILNTKGT